MEHKALLVLIGLTVVVSGCVNQQTGDNTKPVNTNKSVDNRDKYRYGYQTTDIQVNGFNITVNRSVQGYPERNFFIESDNHPGEYQAMVLKAGTADQIFDRCDQAYGFESGANPYPCHKLISELEQ